MTTALRPLRHLENCWSARFPLDGGHFVVFLGSSRPSSLCLCSCLPVSGACVSNPWNSDVRRVAEVRMWFGSGSFEHSCVCRFSRTPECGGDSGTHDQ